MHDEPLQVPISGNGLIALRHAVQATGLSIATLRHLIRARELSAVKLRSRIYLPAPQVRTLMKGTPPQKRKKADSPGPHIYVMNCGPYTKIGYTADNSLKRRKSILSNNPFEITVWAVAPGDRKTERALHKRFAKYHHRYEWFEFRDGKDELEKAILELGGRRVRGATWKGTNIKGHVHERSSHI